MKTINLKLKENSYPIYVGDDLLNKIPTLLNKLKVGTDAIIISHSRICAFHAKGMRQSLIKAGYSVKIFNVPEGEQSKSANCALDLIEKIARYDVNRKPFIIAFGGGVIGDLAGFVAAIYKRGIPVIQVPTTLLAQIDSSIGGKTAIDLKYGKNLVGAFYQPKAVIIDTQVLKTLSVRQIRNGMAEAIKYGIIKDKKLFSLIKNNVNKVFLLDKNLMAEIISSCVRIKAVVVQMDEKETKGIRTILNFGHTIGHAIEAAANFRYQHGECVALGMRAAARISVLKNLLSVKQENEIYQVISAMGLPMKFTGIKKASILDLMLHDKKFVGGRNRFVLAESIGKVRVVEDIPQEIILKSIESIC